MRSTEQSRILRQPLEAAYDYVADFARTPEWDPGVVGAERLDDGPVGTGSRFRVMVRTMGRVSPMMYRIVEHDRPHRLVLEGSNRQTRATDVITFFPAGEQRTRVHWRLDLELLGAGRWVEPFMGPVLHRLGRVALDGLARRLIRAPGPSGRTS